MPRQTNLDLRHGDTHLEIIVSRLAKKFGVDVELTKPKIPYKETIKGTVEVEGKHKSNLAAASMAMSRLFSSPCCGVSI